MTRADMDAWAADLRRSVGAATGTDNTGAGLVIYVGDMRWAVDSSSDDSGLLRTWPQSSAACCFRLRAADTGTAWLV
ncbi:unnamed protein product [Miscanthus lutarioriparius]|uniref:Uncharacterized protein n=1 Tax=Miscanthus lutarioriparius TaxID=422564 RepID=A0A811NQC3_9POAL|nr:unnamed protein product [Miscanthus lutarioriparius]